MLRRVRLLRSPIDELTITGSRWSRLLARAVRENAAKPPKSPAPAQCITLIPTLHVASVEFYDKVLDYMVQAVKQRDNVVILLEGICDNEEGEVQQMEEYFEIARNEELKAIMLHKADQNTLYNEETMKAICEELSVKYEPLVKAQATVRLQDFYLKPKMAALVGGYLRNDADLNMKEVEALLLDENSSGSGNGDTCIPISRLGVHPAVRGRREAKVAKAAQLRCVEWFHRECDGEVIVPWGFYHAEGIKHNILAMNAHDADVVFVESDDTLCRVPFGVSKELLA
ncbi:putative mitochondrial DNA topoisomerase II [Trypanosoma grayi]|uniref:putative mitochondrial DNA topoisomerase II n=1 Tax=Trypanosoma grayi TaxID=71804 RepID=UPI0004F413B0|nr:putative mitochondrial DNA topoisomerase II [Trypanosoma grayi]KEG11792.1 putative mitochondrial DNA topoisomerase II [Trypanosoma grayi]